MTTHYWILFGVACSLALSWLVLELFEKQIFER